MEPTVAPGIVDAERKLALAYAPGDVRNSIALLVALDERLASIVSATREPMLGRIRLTWWREALEKLATDPRGGEPMLAALADLVAKQDLDPVLLAGMAEGWMILLDPLPLDEAALIAHADARGGALFALISRIGGEAGRDVADAGAGWALADVASRTSDGETAERARALARDRFGRSTGRWPARLRMLAVLTAFARRDAEAQSHHQKRKGSPGRVARAVWAGLTGR